MHAASLRFQAAIAGCVLFMQAGPLAAEEWDHQQDVVYGYKHGMALIMDVFTPRDKPNGAGVIRLTSGGMISNPVWSHRATDKAEVRSLLEAGYVVFAVTHSSQPKYSINEIFPDTPRAVRFIRHNAERFGVDPWRLGIMGASSGGHLSLLAATNPPAPDLEASDPVDRVSSELQAVVSYFAGTDNVNFGRENTTIEEHFRSQGFEPGTTFDFHAWDDETHRYERVTDPEERRRLFRESSPITHVTAETPPVLLLHGDKDKLVPLQQSQVFAARLRDAGVSHKLFVVEGQGHGYAIGWETPVEGELAEVLNWFDRHLAEASE